MSNSKPGGQSNKGHKLLAAEALVLPSTHARHMPHVHALHAQHAVPHTSEPRCLSWHAAGTCCSNKTALIPCPWGTSSFPSPRLQKHSNHAQQRISACTHLCMHSPHLTKFISTWDHRLCMDPSATGNAAHALFAAALCAAMAAASSASEKLPSFVVESYLTPATSQEPPL
jgi:hypothetical protein